MGLAPQEGVGQECGEEGLLIPGMRRMREHWCGRHIHSPIDLLTSSSPHQPPMSFFLAWVPLAFNDLLQICQCFGHWLHIKLASLPIHPQNSELQSGRWGMASLWSGDWWWSGVLRDQTLEERGVQDKAGRNNLAAVVNRGTIKPRILTEQTFPIVVLESGWFSILNQWWLVAEFKDGLLEITGMESM